jgi:hypothetical protein
MGDQGRPHVERRADAARHGARVRIADGSSASTARSWRPGGHWPADLELPGKEEARRRRRSSCSHKDFAGLKRRASRLCRPWRHEFPAQSAAMTVADAHRAILAARRIDSPG